MAQYVGNYQEYLNAGGKASSAAYYKANPSAPGAAKPTGNTRPNSPAARTNSPAAGKVFLGAQAGYIDANTTFSNGSVTMTAAQLANRNPEGRNGLTFDKAPNGEVQAYDSYGDESWSLYSAAPRKRASPSRSVAAPQRSSSGGGGGGGGGSSTPSNYGLDGKVSRIDTEALKLPPWQNVNVPWDPAYLATYKEWAKSGFINREVNPNDLVQQRLDELLNKQGKYISAARQRGVEQAASRGLLNSSIAAGSAERAAIEAALPIAKQDASTYFSQGINNQNLANQFSLARQNAGMTGMMEMDKLKETLEAEFARFNGEMDVKVDSFNATMSFEEAMDAREKAQQEFLTRAEAWSALERARISANTSISVADIQAASQADSVYKKGLLDIWGNPDITPQQSGVFTDQWRITNNYATNSAVRWDQAYR